MYSVLLFVCLAVGAYGQRNAPIPLSANKLHTGLTNRIGNFSLELLYRTARAQGDTENMILSPITVWTVLAVIAEGAVENTFEQIRHAARIPPNITRVHSSFNELTKWLTTNSSAVELALVNSIFADTRNQLEKDYADFVSRTYKTVVIPVDFSTPEVTANTINHFIQQATRGRIKNLIDSASLAEAEVLITSALYFKGRWTSPFNATSTERKPFYNSGDRKIGEVNMMYNRYTYPFAHISKLQARVIELPYGVENRLSMLIMLPYPNVSLENMFLNFQTSSLSFDDIFKELRVSQEEFSDDEVDCFIPRFKIESNLNLNAFLQDMGIRDLFNAHAAKLPKIARKPLYVSKVIHKAEIEVTEEGTTASAVTAAELANRIGVVRFEANRPFVYMIVEKTTNSIVFGGLYRQPVLY